MFAMLDVQSIRCALPDPSCLYDVTDISVYACEGTTHDSGYLIVLDGSKVMPFIQLITTENPSIASYMPVFIGVDVADRLSDFTPWPHAANSDQFHDFGGTSDRFITDTLLPLKQALDGCISGDSGLLGYSLGGLCALTCLNQDNAFDNIFAISPSVWYPGFVDWLSQLPIFGCFDVRIFYGLNEGQGKITPLCDVKAYVDQTAEVLRCVPQISLSLSSDSKKHHDGLPLRIKKMLQTYY